MKAGQKVLNGPLAEIELKTKAYAEARDVLSTRVLALNDELASLKARRLQGIKTALAEAAALQADLKAAIEATPSAFEKPRTQIFHGIKVGYRKGSGKIEFDDADRVVALIEKHLPEQADVLVKVTKKPVKKALEGLDAAELKKLGITIEDTGDVVVVAAVDGEVDKLVTALLKEATDEAEDQ